MPHITSECLSILKKKINNDWPKINDQLLKDEKVNIAIQINGKTRQVLNLNKNITQDEICNLCKDDEKIKKYLINRDIKKIIFIDNRVLNYIISE